MHLALRMPGRHLGIRSAERETDVDGRSWPVEFCPESLLDRLHTSGTDATKFRGGTGDDVPLTCGFVIVDGCRGR